MINYNCKVAGRMNIEKSYKSKSSAPGQYLGFALQPVRLCFHLLNCADDAFVSIEHLDDVAVHYPDGRILLEQTKSALTHNPLSNWSEDFWKTISNWIDLLKVNGFCHSKVTFRYYVTPGKRMGKICSLFHVSQSDNDIKKLMVSLQKELKKLEVEPSCMKYISRFLNATQEVQKTIIKNLVIENERIDPLDSIRKCLKPTIPEALIELTCQYAIGMAKEKADYLIRNKKDPIISARDFKNYFINFVQKNNVPGFLQPLSQEINSSDAEALLKRTPTFIKQLKLIELRQDRQLRAVSDLLKTDANITMWAENGLIFEKNVSEWHDSLLRQYDSICDEIEIFLSDKSEISRGKVIYSRCSATHVSFDNKVVPEYFTNGGFNLLAEDLRLGWHPDYIELLDKDEE